MSEGSVGLTLAPERRWRAALTTSDSPWERVGRDSPAVSVVIPVPPGSSLATMSARLGGLAVSAARFELLVARGNSPSAQRNAAVQEARGEYILFLDDDSEPMPGLLDLYRAVLEDDPAIGAVGGPAVPRADGVFQRVTALLLGETLVMGRSAARYRSMGGVRSTDEREVILCNMAIRRRAFLDVGGFDESLYPNEENEFLERLTHAGHRVVYHPEAVVHRPQWKTVGRLLRKVFTYGRGRAAQMRRRMSGVSASRLALAFGLPLVAGGSFGACAGGGLAGLFAAPGLYALFLLVVAARLYRRGGLAAAALSPIVTFLVHGGYGVGVLAGLVWPVRRTACGITVKRLRGVR